MPELLSASAVAPTTMPAGQAARDRSGSPDRDARVGRKSENLASSTTRPVTQLHPQLHHPNARAWHEPTIDAKHLVYPIFVHNGNSDVDIAGFSPNKRWGRGAQSSSSRSPFSSLVSHLRYLVEKCQLKAVMLFGVVPDGEKNCTGDAAAEVFSKTENPVERCLQTLKATFGDHLLLMADVCLCEYTDHGHCGILKPRNTPETNDSPICPAVVTSSGGSKSSAPSDPTVIDLEKTTNRLAEIALSYATHGCDFVCPSDMMDGRVVKIRQKLNEGGFSHVGILSYTSKKASTSLYNPFRNAVASCFKGDRKRYQQPVGAFKLAQKSFQRDIAEGADIVLVKPSLFYADIIKSYAEKEVSLVAAYVVSGEYKMLFDYGTACDCLKDVVLEAHVSLLRAGADILITYYTPQILMDRFDLKSDFDWAGTT
ncbi:unnamed protein product [Amoebophrya sp. A120]|nr:unnamed protein product [Amoebophrya sp. A120]|eukprot:GSA120T00007389001.1